MENPIQHVNLKAVEHAADLIEQASAILERAERFINWSLYHGNVRDEIGRYTKAGENQSERYYELRKRLNSVLEDLGTTLGYEDAEHWLPF